MALTELTPATDAQVRRFAVARQIIFAALAVAVVVPLLIHFKLPGKPSTTTKKVFDGLDKLPPGSPVLIAFDFDPSSKGELEPMGLAVLRHCFKKNLHPIVITIFWVTGVDLHNAMTERAAKEAGKVAGRDYVYLGYKPGGTDLILNMGENLIGAFDKDFHGNPTQDMTVFDGVKTLKDMKYAVAFAAGATTEIWIMYGRDRFDFPLAAGCTAVIAPDLYPFLQSGQLEGLLGGLRGAADYEVLVDAQDKAVEGMRPQSVAHLLIIALIAIANIEVLVSYLKKRRA